MVIGELAGSEWKYVMLTTVRSVDSLKIHQEHKEGDKKWKYRHLGSITDQHQINVAITRPQHGLFIIGQLVQRLMTFIRLISLFFLIYARVSGHIMALRAYRLN